MIDEAIAVIAALFVMWLVWFCCEFIRYWRFGR